MPHFDVAHLQEQDQDMLLFPLSSAFGQKTQADQNASLLELELRARAAGLAGRAAAFWERGNRTYYLGPDNWRGFLESMSVDDVMANVNQRISW
jgi:hypothetical protein